MLAFWCLVAACNRGNTGPGTYVSSAEDPSVLAPATNSGAQAGRSLPGQNSARDAVGAASPTPAAQREEAILAGGCFWGMEELLRKIPGVLETDVGYVGGATSEPTYEQVHRGTTGHAEAVRVVFDPSRLTYETLLEHWFFRMHDPTTEDRQGNDIGSQYRSAIFFTSEAQAVSARQVKARVDASGKWQAPVVTDVVAAGPFTLAENYHQDYLQANPDGYTCHYLRD
jgi:peptide methionine sulfoxide reductase msrA/msrB